METKEMRARHDTMPDWVFEDRTGKPAFSKGTIRMDRNDMDTAMDLFYGEMGWDKATGAPTRAAYERVGLIEVARALGEKGLLP
jgi:aldehyde:ferredoxin oxidoreductase